MSDSVPVKLIDPDILPPPIPTEWEYDESVVKSRRLKEHWKNITNDRLNEYWIAHEKLDGRDGRNLPLNVANATSKTWADYCTDVDVDRSTVWRWFVRVGWAKKKDPVTLLEDETEDESFVELGDIWRLGDHILYCGDSSTDEFLGLLEPAALAFADPPYGVNKEGLGDKAFYWEHDYLIDYADVVAVTPGIISIFEFARATEMPYKWSVACWISNGMTRGAMGFGNWIYAAVFSNESVYQNSQDFFKAAIKNDGEKVNHPTRKPADFMAWLIETFTASGDIVIDPFLGSGQTLLVCDRLGRRCIGADIDPGFCSHIIRRWERQTDKKAAKMA